MSDAVFPISAATLQLWFDPGTFQRARAYWQAGKVIKLEYSEDLAQISAQVWGEALAPYRQYLSLKQQDGDWQLTDSCSCPVGGRCKHVLAVLLKLKQAWEQQQVDLQQLPLRQLTQWFADAERQTGQSADSNKLREVVLALEERRNSLPLSDLLRIKTTGVYVNDFSSFIERETGRVDLDTVNPSWLIFSDGFSSGRAISSAVSGRLSSSEGMRRTGRCG